MTVDLLDLLEEGQDTGLFTGAIAIVGDASESTHVTTVGDRDPRDGKPVTERTRFDCASLTKPVVTTTIALHLVETGGLTLNDTIADHLDTFTNHPRSDVTIHQLLTHTSGLQPEYYDPAWENPDEAWSDTVDADLRTTTPGSRFIYSCLNYLHLARIVEHCTNSHLPTLAQSVVFDPLEMDAATLGPINEATTPVCVTRDHDYDRDVLAGEIHDPTAYLWQGRSGNAGLFATASDLAKFARSMLNDGMSVLAPATQRAMFSDHTPADMRPHGLGWRAAADYTPAVNWTPESYGHTGYTGTSLWIDRTASRFAVLLTNEVYTGKETEAMARFRERFYGIAATC